MLALEIAWAAHNNDPCDLATVPGIVVLVKVMSLANALAVAEFFNIRSSFVKVLTTRP